MEAYKEQAESIINSLNDDREKLILTQYCLEEQSIKEICKQLQVSDRIIYKLLKDTRIGKRPTKGQCILNRIYKDKELFYYLLGFIASDGYVYEVKPRVEICIKISDAPLLEVLSMRIYGANLVRYEPHLNTNGRARLFILGKEFVNVLKSYGITQKKSATMQIDYDKIESQYLHHFIRGYYDGDGSLYYKNDNHFRFRIDGNYHTISNINMLIKKYYNISGQFFKVNVHTSFDFYRWVVQQNNVAKQFANIIYQDSTIYLERKYQPIQKFLKQ